MLYLNTKDLQQVQHNWEELISVIAGTAGIIAENDYSQPVKPYLRYKNLRNRIIAMPAYVGGSVNMAGIKWIASFPANLDNGIPRAHAVTVLNNAGTGEPLCMINSTLISEIRTAAVSGAIVSECLKYKFRNGGLHIGIVGFGPIGKMHLNMLSALLKDNIKQISLYDIRGIDEKDIPQALAPQVRVYDNWECFFELSDIFITCTTSREGYIESRPKTGALHLNVSLRDYEPSFRQFVDYMIVDDWDEVCRENTDIERMSRDGLTPGMTCSITDVLCKKALHLARENSTIMFNPMGMAVFDITIGTFFFLYCLRSGIGSVLPD